ncbi:MAG: hypothetical protein U5L95_00465 [Candidatus Saccharibacteria bacterium]|nr:hypothetical protein [Candidatus Saccharibacteria bacterium]
MSDFYFSPEQLERVKNPIVNDPAAWDEFAHQDTAQNDASRRGLIERVRDSKFLFPALGAVIVYGLLYGAYNAEREITVPDTPAPAVPMDSPNVIEELEDELDTEPTLIKQEKLAIINAGDLALSTVCSSEVGAEDWEVRQSGKAGLLDTKNGLAIVTSTGLVTKERRKDDCAVRIEVPLRSVDGERGSLPINLLPEDFYGAPSNLSTSVAFVPLADAQLLRDAEEQGLITPAKAASLHDGRGLVVASEAERGVGELPIANNGQLDTRTIDFLPGRSGLLAFKADEEEASSSCSADIAEGSPVFAPNKANNLSAPYMLGVVTDVNAVAKHGSDTCELGGIIDANANVTKT